MFIPRTSDQALSRHPNFYLRESKSIIIKNSRLHSWEDRTPGEVDSMLLDPLSKIIKPEFGRRSHQEK